MTVPVFVVAVAAATAVATAVAVGCVDRMLAAVIVVWRLRQLRTARESNGCASFLSIVHSQNELRVILAFELLEDVL